MAETNFKIFNEANSADKTYNDSEYENATQRQNGVIPGMAISRMHNKMYLQWSSMCRAIANFIVDQGHDCLDSDIDGIASGLKNAIQSAVSIDSAYVSATDTASADGTKIPTLGFLLGLLADLSSNETVTWSGNNFSCPALGINGLMAENGYISFGKLFGGLILQWGYTTTVSSPTFPISFSDNNYVICYLPQASNDDPIFWNDLYITGKTASSFSMHYSHPSYYMAIGYIK